MKKILFVLPLMALTTLTSCGKPFDPNKIDLYKRSYQYSGNKKKLDSTTDYEYNDQDLLIKSTEVYNNDQNYVPSKTIIDYTYDEHENCKTRYETDYDSDGDFFRAHYYRYTYQYDNQGRITESIHETCDDLEIGEWKRDSRKTTKYDDKVETTDYYNSLDELKSTSITTYNGQGRITNFKTIYHHQNKAAYGYEKQYILDKYGCAIEMTEYKLDESYNPGKKAHSSTASYLENLYYRPLKITNITYDSLEQEISSNTEERAYNDKNQIVLLKDYEGKDEATTTEYRAYVEYEY